MRENPPSSSLVAQGTKTKESLPSTPMLLDDHDADDDDDADNDDDAAAWRDGADSTPSTAHRRRKR